MARLTSIQHTMETSCDLSSTRSSCLSSERMHLCLRAMAFPKLRARLRMQCHLTDFVQLQSLRKSAHCCTDDSVQCVQDPKQMTAWHQNSAVNVFPPQAVSPGYSGGTDWKAGAQCDISGMALSSPTSSISVPTTTTSTVKGVVRGQAIATTRLGKEDGLCCTTLPISANLLLP